MRPQQKADHRKRIPAADFEFISQRIAHSWRLEIAHSRPKPRQTASGAATVLRLSSMTPL